MSQPTFDPDAYLKSKTAADTSGFNPDAYLAQKGQAPTSQGWGDVLGTALGNIPSSAVKMANDIWSAITSPVQTAKGIGNLAIGAAKSAANPLPYFLQQPNTEMAPVVQFYAQRYGGVNNLKNTIAQDPVGFLADVSTLLSGAGGAIKSGALGMAAKIADPVAMPGNIARQVARTIPQNVPVRIYESAIKPSTTLSDAERARIALTGLTESIPPTKRGLNTLRATVGDLNNQIGNQIASGAQAGETVNAYDVAKRLQSPVDFYGKTVNPAKPLEDIKNVGDQFIAAHGPNIPIDKAQKIKQNTYQTISNSYGELSNATKEAQKNLARGIKEEIVAQHPEIANLNAREGALLELESAIQSAVGRIYNKELFPTASLWTGAAAAGVTGDVGTGIEMFLARAALENATVKAKLAIALNKARAGTIKGGKIPFLGVASRPVGQ